MQVASILICVASLRGASTRTWHIGITQAHGIYLSAKGISRIEQDSSSQQRPPARTYFKFNGLTNGFPERTKNGERRRWPYLNAFMVMWVIVHRVIYIRFGGSSQTQSMETCHKFLRAALGCFYMYIYTYILFSSSLHFVLVEVGK